MQSATTTLIPKPCGTGSHGDFNLTNEMKVDTGTRHQIEVSFPFHSPTRLLIARAGFCSFTREDVNPRQE